MLFQFGRIYSRLPTESGEGLTLKHLFQPFQPFNPCAPFKSLNFGVANEHWASLYLKS